MNKSRKHSRCLSSEKKFQLLFCFCNNMFGCFDVWEYKPLLLPQVMNILVYIFYLACVLFQITGNLGLTQLIFRFLFCFWTVYIFGQILASLYICQNFDQHIYLLESWPIYILVRILASSFICQYPGQFIYWLQSQQYIYLLVPMPAYIFD